jgi:hypothetical protein
VSPLFYHICQIAVSISICVTIAVYYVTEKMSVPFLLENTFVV